MHHFLVQLGTDNPDFNDEKLAAYFRKQPYARTLCRSHGQWFELLATDDAHLKVFVTVATLLEEGDRFNIREIPDAEIPSKEADGAEWVRSLGTLSNLVEIPQKGTPLRTWAEEHPVRF